MLLASNASIVLCILLIFCASAEEVAVNRASPAAEVRTPEINNIGLLGIIAPLLGQLQSLSPLQLSALLPRSMVEGDQDSSSILANFLSATPMLGRDIASSILSPVQRESVLSNFLPMIRGLSAIDSYNKISGTVSSPDAIASPDSISFSDSVSSPEPIASPDSISFSDSVSSPDAIASPDLVSSSDSVSSSQLLSPLNEKLDSRMSNRINIESAPRRRAYTNQGYRSPAIFPFNWDFNIGGGWGGGWGGGYGGGYGGYGYGYPYGGYWDYPYGYYVY